MREERALLHLDERTWRAIDPGSVYRVLPIARGELPWFWRALREGGRAD